MQISRCASVSGSLSWRTPMTPTSFCCVSSGKGARRHRVPRRHHPYQPARPTTGCHRFPWSTARARARSPAAGGVRGSLSSASRGRAPGRATRRAASAFRGRRFGPAGRRFVSRSVRSSRLWPRSPPGGDLSDATAIMSASTMAPPAIVARKRRGAPLDCMFERRVQCRNRRRGKRRDAEASGQAIDECALRWWALLRGRLAHRGLHMRLLSNGSAAVAPLP